MIAGEILPWGGHKAILGGVRGLPEAKLRFFFCLKTGCYGQPSAGGREKKILWGSERGEKKAYRDTQNVVFIWVDPGVPQ